MQFYQNIVKILQHTLRYENAADLAVDSLPVDTPFKMVFIFETSS